jgi:hypothetical protein
VPCLLSSYFTLSLSPVFLFHAVHVSCLPISRCPCPLSSYLFTVLVFCLHISHRPSLLSSYFTLSLSPVLLIKAFLVSFLSVSHCPVLQSSNSTLSLSPVLLLCTVLISCPPTLHCPYLLSSYSALSLSPVYLLRTVNVSCPPTICKYCLLSSNSMSVSYDLLWSSFLQTRVTSTPACNQLILFLTCSWFPPFDQDGFPRPRFHYVCIVGLSASSSC